uniref:Uncharacterized protein n=2 Tax=Physcomitrium patens TaxID=3218 RepID=A0A2K1IGI0_PHYPA|nr:hypothetical protein PHYPA_028979 [Physcomitrium patens]
MKPYVIQFEFITIPAPSGCTPTHLDRPGQERRLWHGGANYCDRLSLLSAMEAKLPSERTTSHLRNLLLQLHSTGPTASSCKSQRSDQFQAPGAGGCNPMRDAPELIAWIAVRIAISATSPWLSVFEDGVSSTLIR